MVPLAYHNCAATQRQALTTRALQQVIKCTAAGQSMLDTVVSILTTEKTRQGTPLLPTKLGLQRRQDYVNSCSGSKRVKYQNALDSSLGGKMQAKWFNCTMFVKTENFNPGDKVQPDPRAIIFRDPRGALILRQVVGPIEEKFYQTGSSPNTFPNVGPIFGKGRDSLARAAMVMDNLRPFTKPAVVAADASRFDRTINANLHDAKFKLMGHMSGKAGERILKQTREWYLHPTIRSTAGHKIKPKCESLKSGDMDTALGNNIVAYVIHIAFRRFLNRELDQATQAEVEGLVGVPGGKLREHEYAVLIDGDDVQFVVEENTLTWVRPLFTPFFALFGVNMRIDHVALSKEDIEWCQAKPIQVEPGLWRMVRMPRKVVSSALSGPRWLVGEKGMRRRAKAIGECELVLNGGVPVLSAFASALKRAGGGYKPSELENCGTRWRHSIEVRAGNAERAGLDKAVPITTTARISFWASFGITPDEQIRMEGAWERWQLPIMAVDVGFDQREWVYIGLPRLPDLSRL